MAKKKIKTDGSGAVMANLFEMVEEVTIAKVDQPNYQLNTKPMSQRVREVVSEALKRTDCKRWEVAGRMSELCGVEITESMLNAWTAESKENHRFPLELVPAFCQVTGDFTLIEMTAYACGCMVVQSNAWDSLTGIIDGMIDSVVEFGQTLWNTFAEMFPGVASFIDSMQNTFFNSGAALWDAFCNGIQSVLAKPAELVREGLQMIRNLLPFSDAKEGPLSQLTRSGRAVMATMAEGVPDSYGNLQSAVATGFDGIDLKPNLPVNPDWNLEGVPSVPEVVMEPALYMDALRSVMPVQPEPGRNLAELASVQKLPIEPDWNMKALNAVPKVMVEADWYIDPLAKMPEIPQWGMDPAWMQDAGFMPEKPDRQTPDPFEMVTPRRERQPQQAVQLQKEGRKIIIYGDIHIEARQMNNANDFMEALRVIADSEGDGDAD